MKDSIFTAIHKSQLQARKVQDDRYLMYNKYGKVTLDGWSDSFRFTELEDALRKALSEKYNCKAYVTMRHSFDFETTGMVISLMPDDHSSYDYHRDINERFLVEHDDIEGHHELAISVGLPITLEGDKVIFGEAIHNYPKVDGEYLDDPLPDMELESDFTTETFVKSLIETYDHYFSCVHTVEHE